MQHLFQVDPAGDTPLHRQVYEGLRSAILSGRLKSGDRLPATRALAGQLALSRSTIADAYEQLQAEGYILGRHGSGTYVAPDLPHNGLQPESRGYASSTAAPGLSRWGRRIATPEFSALLRPREEVWYPYDFRPHRIAQDEFPWDAWRSSVERALTSDRSRLFTYPPAAGHPDLRRAIAEHVAGYRAVSCTPNQIVIVNGTQQGLNLLVQLLLESGDRVAVEDPGYPAARLSFESRSLAISPVAVDHDGMIVSRLADLGPHRMVHVTPSHQDPTGATLSLPRRLALLEIAARHGMLVVEDDYDSEFRYEGRPVESLQGLDRNGLVVYAGTFSKSVLAGLRIGFLVVPDALSEPIVDAKALWDSGAPILEQAALAQFMLSGQYERHIRRMRRLYRIRRDALLGALADEFGERATVGERHGGINLLVTLDLALTEEEIVRRAASEGIGLRGASRYFRTPPAGPTFLLGFAQPDPATIRDGIRRLRRLVDDRSVARG